MSMTEHTPGPWQIEPIKRLGNALCVISAQGDRVARCDGINLVDDVPPKQCRANAHLIAAAPDLMEACKQMLRVAEVVGIRTHVDPIYANAIAAIAKAEGRAK